MPGTRAGPQMPARGKFGAQGGTGAGAAPPTAPARTGRGVPPPARRAGVPPPARGRGAGRAAPPVAPGTGGKPAGGRKSKAREAVARFKRGELPF